MAITVSEGYSEKIEKEISSPSFKRWFKGSKVVDAGGKPQIVYHGSGTRIDKFDFKFTGQGNDEIGSGFYFTTAKNVARGYTSSTDPDRDKIGGESEPTLHAVFLSIKKPIDADRDDYNVTTSQVLKIIQRSPDLEEKLWDWADLSPGAASYGEGRSVAIKRACEAYAEKGVNLIKQLNKLSKDFFGDKEGIKIFNEAVRDTLGFDGVFRKYGEQTNWAAWFPEQIWIVDRKKKGEDGFNEEFMESPLSESVGLRDFLLSEETVRWGEIVSAVKPEDWVVDRVEDEDETLEIKTMLPSKIAKMRTMHGDMTVTRAFEKYAEPWQQALVKDYEQAMNEGDFPDKPYGDVIIIDGNRVLDGHHRVVAAVRSNKSLRYVEVG